MQEIFRLNESETLHNLYVILESSRSLKIQQTVLLSKLNLETPHDPGTSIHCTLKVLKQTF